MSRRFDVIHACIDDDARTQALATAFVARAGRRMVHLDERTVAEVLGDVEILAVGKAPRIDWSRARRLVLVQMLGSGTDALWPAAGLPPDTAVANTRGMHLPEMRDHALALLFAFARDLPRALGQQLARRWEPFPGGTLAGKTVAVLGLGEVGGAVAAACAALGMTVLGVRARPRPTPHVHEVHGPDALDHVLPRADYVVVLLPLTPATRGLLDARALASLPAHAVVVHLSRGGVVDEAALSAAVRDGRLRGAAFDVFAEEPLPEESPLWGTPGILVTPHLAGLVGDYFERALGVLLENVERLERGMRPRTEVDRARGY
jgi:phosphoglycerate dehydrogenase-like enzyme